MTSIDLNSMTAMNLDGLPTKIAVNDLNVWYGKFHALKHITLAIPEGRVTAFIGPSGCGKSTLLRTFNRMYALYPGQRAEGELMLDGVNILSGTIDDCTLRSRVGMVFQRPTPFPMSIYDNIAYGIRLRENVAKSELDDRVEWALKKAALWNDVKDKLREPGTSLSGGQQQRLCIARGVAVKPEVLCSTSRARPLTRSRPPASRSSLRSSRTTTRSSSSLTPCSRPPASPTTRPSSTSAN